MQQEPTTHGKVIFVMSILFYVCALVAAVVVGVSTKPQPATPPIDYDALAKQYGATSSTPPPTVYPVPIDVQCDSCRSYGESVADAVKTALRQSDKFDYAYLASVDTHVVVAERDGSVYVDLLTENGAQRITQNIATFHKSGDVFDANQIADAIYAVYPEQTAKSK